MEILNLVQGSDEWLEARLNYLCASEAPAMMGDSKFMSRNQLLALKKGWQSNPISDFKKRLFEKGHENEDSARELLEFDLCEELPPVVGLSEIEGMKLLSSYDGFGDFGYLWEHKDWNEVLAENVRNGVLEPMYYWQLEHQMLTANLDQVHFMVSDGTAEKRVSMTYKSVPALRAQLIAGWKQFLIDLESYELEAKKETVIARKQEAFPTIECRVEGSMVISNLGDYIPLIEDLAEEQMNLVLESDQDFEDKEAFNKNVKLGRASLKAKAAEIETEFESLAEFNGYVLKADSILQKLQSHGEKQVKEAKEAKKLSITTGAQSELQKHLSTLSQGINGIQLQNIEADWAAIIKGKRSFEKMQEAVEHQLAKLKIEANELAAIIRKNLDTLTELASEHKFLFSDHGELVLKNNDDLINLIKMRIAEHEKAEAERLEKERQRIQDEAEAKAQREAEAKAEAEREKIRQQEQEKAKAEALAAQQKREEEAKAAREKQAAEEARPLAESKPAFEEPPLKSVPPRKQQTEQDQSFDLVARFVPGYGYLPIVIKGGEETYRGEFQRTAIEAIERCEHSLQEAA